MGKHFVRFLKTREWILFLFLGVMAIWYPANWLNTIGQFIGVGLYVITERTAHIAMHTVKTNPFYMTHRIHHSLHTPESGVPQWWLFGVYGLVTLVAVLAARPLLFGIWFGILIMLTIYEWIHFLYHCDYMPRTVLGTLLRHHHLEHHKDPTTNFDVIVPGGK